MILLLCLLSQLRSMELETVISLLVRVPGGVQEENALGRKDQRLLLVLPLLTNHALIVLKRYIFIGILEGLVGILKYLGVSEVFIYIVRPKTIVHIFLKYLSVRSKLFDSILIEVPVLSRLAVT